MKLNQTITLLNLLAITCITTSAATLNIKEGWNLLSANIDDLSTVPTQAKILWTYKDNQWYAYSRDFAINTTIINNAYPTFSTLNITQGTWIYTDETFDLNILENNTTNETNYPKGWHLLGNGITQSVENFGCSSAKLAAIWKYKDFHWQLYTPQANTYSYTPFNTIEANEGFWLNCIDYSNLTISKENDYLQINDQNNEGIYLKDSMTLDYKEGMDPDAFSISLWIKLPASNTNQQDETILAFQEEDENRNSGYKTIYELTKRFKDEYNVTSTQYNNDGSIAGTTITTYPATTDVVFNIIHSEPYDGYSSQFQMQGLDKVLENDWHHFVFTFNPDYSYYSYSEQKTIEGQAVAALYYNGKVNISYFHEFNGQVSSILPTLTNPSLFLGSFDGYVDDIRIYSKTLSGEEIETLYNAGRK